MACFNEAAGIHRRKRTGGFGSTDKLTNASMRPPEFTGGNKESDGYRYLVQKELQ